MSDTRPEGPENIDKPDDEEDATPDVPTGAAEEDTPTEPSTPPDSAEPQADDASPADSADKDFLAKKAKKAEEAEEAEEAEKAEPEEPGHWDHESDGFWSEETDSWDDEFEEDYESYGADYDYSYEHQHEDDQGYDESWSGEGEGEGDVGSGFSADSDAAAEAGGDNPGGELAVSGAGGSSAIATTDEDDWEHEEEEGGPTMSLGEHLEELRKRLIYALVGLVLAMVATMCFGKQILGILQEPYIQAMRNAGVAEALIRLNVLRAQDGFLIYFRVSLISGLILSAPWTFYHLWKFVAAGLYKRERRYVMSAVPFSAILFICGSVFFLLVVSKTMLAFFIGFNQWLGVTPMVTLKDHIKFMTTLMLVFGLGFQTPLVVFVLGKVGIVSLKTLNKYRKHVIVLFLILAALVTSPSPVDQIALAIPMWLLYELGILLVYLSTRKKKDEDEGTDLDTAD